ncbi:MAG TPA: trypsin-like peptidase domain-containing protein [Pirellulales bacterium]|jgi:serine protease Do|nr:trypsin-like peptidase domain-containing protein [Pirellulales bacterium]
MALQYDADYLGRNALTRTGRAQVRAASTPARLRRWLLPSLAAMLIAATALPAAAQLPGDPEPTQAERDKQYAALSHDVSQLEQMGMVLKRVVKLVRPTIVHIEATKADPLAKRYSHQSIEEAGSGTIFELSGNYYVLTNRHVIRSATEANIHIKLSDGRTISPTKVWSDPGTDVAVLAISAPHVYPAHIGNSDLIDIGDFVLAVGSPFGLSHTVTFGIISAKGRRDLELGDERIQFQDFLQTDAAINPGNSGGPLLNLRGEVVGMNTAIATSSGGSEGIGFTIPINMAMSIARQLIEKGSVVRAFLGVTLDPNFSDQTAASLGLPRVEGSHVTGITPNSPASAAKLQVDDVILEFNGVPVDDDAHLVNLVSLTDVGKAVPIVVFRDRKLVRLTVKVGDRAHFDAS